MYSASWGLGVLGIIFFLVIILGLQIQITALSREMDEMRKKLKDK